MLVLKFIFLFHFFKVVFSLNNTLPYNKFQNSMNIIQNTPVENNIPLIIHEIDKNNYLNKNIINKTPFNIPILLPNGAKENVIITNTSIKINMTKKDPMCTKECCMGCQVQFPKLISQKNCIINICKCQIISINNLEIKNNTNTTNNEIKDINTIILLGSMNNNINNNLNEKNSSYFYYYFLLIVFISYESYILYNLNLKNSKFIGKNNNTNLEIEKNKEKRINNYMELLYGDDELIECLI